MMQRIHTTAVIVFLLIVWLFIGQITGSYVQSFLEGLYK